MRGIDLLVFCVRYKNNNTNAIYCLVARSHSYHTRMKVLLRTHWTVAITWCRLLHLKAAFCVYMCVCVLLCLCDAHSFRISVFMPSPVAFCVLINARNKMRRECDAIWTTWFTIPRTRLKRPTHTHTLTIYRCICVSQTHIWWERFFAFSVTLFMLVQLVHTLWYTRMTWVRTVSGKRD